MQETKRNSRMAVIFLAIILFISLLPSYTVATGSTCSSTDEALMRRRRLQGIRASILAQLGLTEAPTNGSNTTVEPVPAAISETFDVLAAATNSLEKEKTRMCESENNYAQQISSFVGTIEGGVANYPSKRSIGEGLGGDTLAEYTMKFDFNLNENLQDFTRADLLLYQIPISRRANTEEYQQHIEIKAVYEEIGLTSVVSAKNVNPFEGGYQAFDIAPAVQSWITQGRHGNVTIKVSVQCFSCGGTSHKNPDAVSFKDFGSKEHAPRIIIKSRNPLENTAGGRNKRQTSNKPAKCSENQISCCLNTLNISFVEDLGFDFVAKPATFEANFCSGICFLYHKMTPQVYQFLDGLQGIPVSNLEPCCAGNTFGDLKILLRKPEGGFVIDELAQVRITSCRCA